MRKKYYDIPIDHPLNDAKKESVGKFIAENAHLHDGEVTHEWSTVNPHQLNLATPPLAWEIIFHPATVEVFGSGPAWAKMLFTKKRQDELHGKLEDLLKQAGFIGPKPGKVKAKVG